MHEEDKQLETIMPTTLCGIAVIFKTSSNYRSTTVTIFLNLDT